MFTMLFQCIHAGLGLQTLSKLCLTLSTCVVFTEVYIACVSGSRNKQTKKRTYAKNYKIIFFFMSFFLVILVLFRFSTTDFPLYSI